MRSRYDELREDIPILDVLLDLGAAVNGWAGGGWQDWKPITCPFCTDSDNSASYNPALGRFLCHQCGAPRDSERSGDVVDVAKCYLGTKDDKEAMTWLNNRYRR